MKRIFTILPLLFILLQSGIYAQDRKNEFNLGIGIWSSDQIVGTLTDIIVGEILTDTHIMDAAYYGSFHLSYKRSLTRIISLGGVFAFDHGIADAVRNEIKVGELTRNYYTFAVEADFRYINNEKLKLYSAVGIGASIYQQIYHELPGNEINRGNIVAFNFQISPIGVKFGDQFGGFVELGFGYKGILIGGFLFRF